MKSSIIPEAALEAWGLALNPDIPDKAVTPLVPSAFRKLLCQYPDRDFVDSLIGMLENGANIGFCGPDQARSTPNAPTAREHDDELRKAIRNEMTWGTQSAPFPNRHALTLSLVHQA